MNRMIAALFLCIVSAGAYAQASPAPGTTPDAPHAARMARAEQQLQSRFANANTTRDGKLTREQAAAGMPMVARHFDEIDTQRAGSITLPQIEAFMAKQMMSR
ncbi:hypothetical protein [Cupriavidus plantarum]|uniref:EF-hand domain-containing protein n=1 Tax=Cupriavidus plantarum TaxID=942865 RepID=A0A316EJV3_9BURK|nr:hypothetical protein [Cupriavidus plantarum]NYI02375.1 hypothetical protein [Cupriavidus plantarum]PWK31580.1 hypothetical protein C7419_10937 [Cupriavidus plantarum]